MTDKKFALLADLIVIACAGVAVAAGKFPTLPGLTRKRKGLHLHRVA